MRNKPMVHFSSRKRLIVAAISACFASAPAFGNPTAPQVVNGAANFNQSGNLLTVTNSNGAIINWNSFSIGANETTRFNQSSAASSVLNRVIANDPSVLLGTLSSNGKVWLVNPAGILVGQGARIDVAGFVASTLNVRNEDFLAGRLNFGATPNAGSIQNYGQITTPSGGSVYLIAPEVENHGIIHAPNGEVILAAGQTVQLLDTGTPGVKVDITGAEGDVTNLGEIVAEAGRIGMAGVLVRSNGLLDASSVVKEGGRIFLKASRDAYVDGAGRIVATGTKGGSIEVLGNNVTVAEQGVVDASGGQQGGGHILLLADMDAGLTTVAGRLAAKGGALGGDGGFIETSGAHVKIADSARVNTSAPRGKAGTWLIDPTDYTIANSGGDITPAALATNLYGGNVVIETAEAGAGDGDIFVNDAVSWTSANTLSLRAHRDINVNAPISNSVGGSLVLRADKTGTGTGTVTFYGGGSVTVYGGGRVDLYCNPASYANPTDYSSWLSDTDYTAWMLVNDVGQAYGGTVGLQAMNTNLSGNYALGKNIDATPTSEWNSGAGFAPIGGISEDQFTGTFDGLGHVIDGLVINRPGSNNAGLFGYVGTAGIVRNVGLVGASVSGQDYVGALVGYNDSGTIGNSYATGAVSGRNSVGGLVGYHYYGMISNSYTSGSATGKSYVGGLVGYNEEDGDTNITSVHASVNVNGNDNVYGNQYLGGLVGYNNSGNIDNAYATGSVTGGSGNYVGGLVGYNSSGVVSNSYATGNVSSISYLGGLVGHNSFGTVNNSYATGTVSGSGADIGGLVGHNDHATVSNSHATGNITGGSLVGGLVGYSDYATVSNSYATGSVSGTDNVGGLVGYNAGSVSGSYHSTGIVSGTNAVGGLVGYNSYIDSVSDSYATGNVAGGNNAGGLVGYNYGYIDNAYASGNVSGSNFVGGLVGFDGGEGNISNTYAAGSVSGSENVGALVGNNTGNVSGSFWNSDVNANMPGIGGGTTTGATGRTAEQMMQLATFTSAEWDIDAVAGTEAVWRIYDGQSAPLLRNFLTYLTVTADNATKSYDR
ncbi:MAG: filamentous hemagglutinin N-terminal domain-containing protein, partial [Burkholderiales bacterium]|nr:filamentous hemagglutinin N-terminal domain-containing protein [Burkholderiales bacterium]